MRWRHCEGCAQLFETAELVTGKVIALHAKPDDRRNLERRDRRVTVRNPDSPDRRESPDRRTAGTH